MYPTCSRVDRVLDPHAGARIGRSLVPHQSIPYLARIVRLIWTLSHACRDDVRPAIAVDVTDCEGHVDHFFVCLFAPSGVGIDEMHLPVSGDGAAGMARILEPGDLVLPAAP